MLQHIPCSATFSIHEKKCFVGRRSFSCKHASHDMLHTVPLAPGGQPWCRGSPWSPGCRGMPAAGLFRPAMPTSKPAMAGLVQELGYQNRRFCYPSNILGVQVIDLDTQDLPPAGSHGVAGHHGRRGAGESPRLAFSGQPCPQPSQPLGGWLGAGTWIPKSQILLSK